MEVRLQTEGRGRGAGACCLLTPCLCHAIIRVILRPSTSDELPTAVEVVAAAAAAPAHGGGSGRTP